MLKAVDELTQSKPRQELRIRRPQDVNIWNIGFNIFSCMGLPVLLLSMSEDLEGGKSSITILFSFLVILV